MPEGIRVCADGRPRCWWAADDPLYLVYHDTEWGRPVDDDRRLFEKLCLEGGETGSLAAYLWSFEPDPTSRPATLDHATLLTFGTSAESKAMSRDLRRRGWAFVGPTTAYAAMEAMGIVDDHVEGCWVRPEVERARAGFRRPIRRDAAGIA